jgi:signal transduction histidine kinase
MIRRQPVFEGIVDAFCSEVQGSVVPADQAAPRLGDLRRQATLILENFHVRLMSTEHPAPVRALPDVGASRANADIHPSSSLAAAGVLFSTALPRLVSFYGVSSGVARTSEQIALCLHETINAVLVQSAVSYVDALLDRLSSAHQEERRRIARDLHDRISHGIGVGVQTCDLALLLLGREQQPDIGRLSKARDVLRETLDDVRTLASSLRDVVGDRRLLTALTEYAEVMLSDDSAIDLRIDDQESGPDLPEFAREEAYLILREALRNAVVHGEGKTYIRIETGVRDGHFHALVADDGIGFDSSRVASGQTVGLYSMTERAEALGGAVSITTSIGAGVVVELLIPQQALYPGLQGP